MKEKLIYCLAIFFWVLLASSLLSGAKVMFTNWYVFPEEISRFSIMMICYIGVVKFIHFIFSILIKK